MKFLTKLLLLMILVVATVGALEAQTGTKLRTAEDIKKSQEASKPDAKRKAQLQKQRAEAKEKNHKGAPLWAMNAIIYEVNIRQYTNEGTFEAFTKHIPRLKEMGVDILWLMPVQPISELNRKGTLGSYYSIADYEGINPEFGNEEDFEMLVKMAHKYGMKVMLDWVGNHTGWDHKWIKQYPDFYKKDDDGKMFPPVEDWTDVVALNYENQRLWGAMNSAMSYWIERYDIDGFRCDVAGMVPTKYWVQARAKLNSIKPLFMLAESEEKEHIESGAFDMIYAWNTHHLMNDLARGEVKAPAFMKQQLTDLKTFPKHSYRMLFTSNHDENTWNGTVEERMGNNAKSMALLTFTLPGMPLIYSGQETGLDHRLEFFEKDAIEWDPRSPWAAFYANLIRFRKSNPALMAGLRTGEFFQLRTTNDENTIAFYRKSGPNVVVVYVNLMDKDTRIKVSGTTDLGTGFSDPFDRGAKDVRLDSVDLPANGYKVYVKNR